MGNTQQDIQWIVREVVRRLRDETDGERAAKRQAPAEAAPDAGVLTIPERLVTLATLDGWLEGVRRVVLRPDAVITPAAKDELRRRSVAIAQGAGSTNSSQASGRLVIAAAGTHFDPAAIMRAAPVDGVCVITGPPGDLPRVTRQLAEEVNKRNQLGMLLTGLPAMAICLTNRIRGIRAALAADLDSVRDAVGTIAANVLVVDPAGRSLYELRNMVREFIGASSRQCPQAYREVLDGKQ